MKTLHFFSFIICSLVIISSSYGQYTNVEQTILFQTKIDNPIKVEVLQKDDQYLFKAHNRSFYKYQLELIFSSIENLTPLVNKRKYILLPGDNNLLTLTIKDKEKGYSNYEYSYKYLIGIPSNNIQLEYPYFIPTNNSFQLSYSNNGNNSYFKDCFDVNNNDTIYNMRKGYVAAVPNLFHEADRISENKSLEIVHEDGTIMIYENIDPKSVFVKPGTIIYPSQPIGIITNDKHLKVALLFYEGMGKLKVLNIKYYIDNSRTDSFSKNLTNISVTYPEEIITKEMSKREIKRYKKNKLF